MGASNIHVGFGKQATWGGAPWIKSAASGIYNNRDLQAEGGGSYGNNDIGNTLGNLSSMLGILGLPNFMGGDILSMINRFFGLDITGGDNMGAYSFNSQYPINTTGPMDDTTGPMDDTTGSMGDTPEYHVPKGEERITPGIPGMENRPGAPDQNSPKPVESGYTNYEGLSQEIQMAATRQQKNPVIIQQPPQSPSTGMQETSTSFGINPETGNRDTRASWAPRIAILRPDDNATRNLTWPARMNPRLA